MKLDNAYEILKGMADSWQFTKTIKPEKKKEKVMSDWTHQSYVDEFLSMRCCGDVLNVCNPIGKNARKEITETMTLIKRVKPLTLHDKNKYNIIDLCAGNALTSVLAVHLLPITYALAFDKIERNREWDRVRKFNYFFGDIYNEMDLIALKSVINSDTIIVSSHPCGELSRQIINIYKQSKAKALFILPCCYGKLRRKYPQELFTKMGQDWVWCYDLAQDINAKMTKDNRCISPRNILLSHVRD